MNLLASVMSSAFLTDVKGCVAKQYVSISITTSDTGHRVTLEVA